MDAQPPERPVSRFGPFEVDLETPELRRAGVPVRIQKLPLQLLSLLLERPGHVVTRQELQKRLWPADTFVDFENGLNTAIKKLREALGDEREHPHFIETVPRQGYRFVANVERRDGNGTAAVVAPGEAILPGARELPRKLEGQKGDERAGGRSFRWERRAVAGAALAGAVLAVWWFNPLPAPGVTQIDQITVSSRVDTPVKPVSDGTHIFYLERDGGHWNLMRTALGGGDGQRVEIPGNNAVAMDIAPEKSLVLLGTFEKRGDENQLWTMPVQGGAATPVGNITTSGAAFSPDGGSIAFTHGTSIWMMDSDGSHARKLADVAGGPSWIVWARDGLRLRFTLASRTARDVTSIWEISRDGSGLRQVLADWRPAAWKCCGAWTPDGRYFIFSAGAGGERNVWALREAGSFWRRSPRGPFQLTSGPATVLNGTPDAEGKRMLFYNGAWRSEVERLDLKTYKFSPLLPNAHATLNSFTRDGKWKAYVDRQNGSLYRSRTDGTEQAVLATGDMYRPAFPRWSPDGKWIAFVGSQTGQPPNAFLVPASGGHPEPLLQGQAEMHDPDWSNTGEKLVLSRAVGPSESDNAELLIVDFATRRAERLPGSDHLAATRWSPDGRFIAATATDQSVLKLWDFAQKKWSILASGMAMGVGVWSPDSRYLYYQDLLSAGQSLYRYDVAHKSIEMVADFSQVLKAAAAHRCALDGITPDGSPVVDFNRGAYDLFAAALRLP